MYHRGAESCRLTLPQRTQGEGFARRHESSRIDHRYRCFGRSTNAQEDPLPPQEMSHCGLMD